MAAVLPQTLKNFNLSVDGIGHAGHVESISLPKLTNKVEEFRAAGMDGPIELDMGIEKLETTIVLSDFNPDLIELFGLLVNNNTAITVRGAMQQQGQAAVAAVIQMTGGFKELDPGEWKPGDKNTLTAKGSVTFYSATVAGEELYYIDLLNMIRRINGVDQLASQRSALGL
jgi:P2 family phage contractile tail tube protein